MSPVVIGDATLYLGDCADVLPALDRVDALISDPPFVMNMLGGGMGSKRKYINEIHQHLDGGFDFSILDKFQNWLVFCSKAQIVGLIGQAEKQGIRWSLLTWNKTNPTPLTHNNYLPDTEYMIHACKSHNFESKTKFIVGTVERNDFDHPTVKPQYVMQKVIRSASHVGGIVLDPFMGTASTGVAALHLGRKFIGIEKEERYFEIACRRIEQAVSQGKLFAPEQPKQTQEPLL